MTEPPVTRGFVGRRRAPRPDRLPPGQYDAGEQWPVLAAEPTPLIDPDSWSLRIDGLVERERTWDLRALTSRTYERFDVDLHCVTAWSRLDTAFTGVRVADLLAEAGPLATATHVLAHSRTGYTANLPLSDVVDHPAWVVWEAQGAPLTPEHGGPVRLLVPHLYLWKSVKWLSRLELMDHDEPGFWERGGYHDRGDPWREQRYQGDP